MRKTIADTIGWFHIFNSWLLSIRTLKRVGLVNTMKFKLCPCQYCCIRKFVNNNNTYNAPVSTTGDAHGARKKHNINEKQL